MKRNTGMKEHHVRPSSRALLRATKVRYVLLLALCFLAQIYHAAKSDATEVTQSSTEEEIALFRAVHRIPSEEKEMTNHELFEAITSPNGTWAPAALRLRANLASIQEVEVLANEFIAFANALEVGSRRRLFASEARGAFPDNIAVRILRETLLDSASVRDLEVLVHEFTPAYPLSPEAHADAAKVLVEVHRRLTEDMDSFDVDLAQYRDDLYRLFWNVVAALGNCGDPGLDALLELPYNGAGALWETKEGLYALGRIGTERAVALIFEHLNRTQSSDSRLDCLEGLVVLPDLNGAQGLRDFVRGELPQHLADPNSSVRRHAVRIAGKTRDPAFLSALEDLAANDPHVALQESGYTDPVEYFPVRKAAQRAIESIKKANKLYSKRELLELELRDLEEKLAKYQAEKEVPALSAHKAEYIQGTQREIDELKQTIAALPQE